MWVIMAKHEKNPFMYAWVYAVIVFLGHTLPEGRFTDLVKVNKLFSIIFSDKSLHFFVYGILAWLLCFGFYRSGRSKIPYIEIFVLSMAYGILIEVWQIFLPFRAFQWSDMGFDFLGISCAILTFALMKRWRILLRREV